MSLVPQGDINTLVNVNVLYWWQLYTHTGHRSPSIFLLKYHLQLPLNYIHYNRNSWVMHSKITSNQSTTNSISVLLCMSRNSNWYYISFHGSCCWMDGCLGFYTVLDDVFRQMFLRNIFRVTILLNGVRKKGLFFSLGILGSHWLPTRSVPYSLSVVLIDQNSCNLPTKFIHFLFFNYFSSCLTQIQSPRDTSSTIF
jgi:hypothetical protein